MASRISDRAKQNHQNNQILPSNQQQLLYTLNNFSYRLQAFNISGVFQRIVSSQLKSHQEKPFFLMGKKIDSLSQCLYEQRELIFFSYRKNFKLTADISSDFGWGCLLRVGQMVLAQAIRLHFQHRYLDFHNSEIIQSFLELEDASCPYGIQKLTHTAQQLWKKNVGQWYSMMEILSVIQQTHLKYSMQGTEDLIIKIYNQSIDIDELKTQLENFAQTFTDPGFVNTQFQKKTYTIQEGRKQEIQLTKSIGKVPQLKKEQKSILVIVNTKMGNKVVNDSSYDKLLALMELPLFMGCIAGVKGKAKFITGKHDQSLSYFDPHFVQQAEFKLSKEQMESFICRDYVLMSKKNLHPQISVCFFLKNMSDLKILMNGIDKIQQQQCCQKSIFINYHVQYETEDSDNEIQLFRSFNLTHSEQNFQLLEERQQNSEEQEQFLLIQ